MVMMDRTLYLWLFIGLGIVSTVSAMYDAAHFKTLLAAKNYPQIREEVERSWPEERQGLRLEWQDSELALIGTQQPNIFFEGLWQSCGIRGL